MHGPSVNAHPPHAETSRWLARFYSQFPRVLPQTSAPTVRRTDAVPPTPPAKPLPALPPEFAAWHRPPVARLAAPTAAKHPWCSQERETLSDCLPPLQVDPRFPQDAALHRVRPEVGAVATGRPRALHPTSSQPAPCRKTQSSLPVETRCPRRCPRLPIPAPPERAAAPCGAVESKPHARAPCAGAAPFPGAGSPSSPTCFSRHNVSTGSDSHGS